MDFETVCRTCLDTESLNPIFKSKDHQNWSSMDILDCTGLKIELNDGLPQNICRNCTSHINKCIRFRLKCKDVESKLLENSNNFEYVKLDIKNNIPETKIDEESVNALTEEEIEDSEDEKPLFFLTKNPTEQTDTKFQNTGASDEKNVFDSNNITIDYKDDFIFDDTNTEYLNEEIFTETNSNKTTDSFELECKKERIICELCNKSLSVRSYKNHMLRSHLESGGRKVKCDFCDSYLIKERLQRHLDEIHNGGKFCKYCNQQFKSIESLVRHAAQCADKRRKRRTHSIAIKEMSECDVCHKKMQKASLKMHILVKHGGGGPACEHCGRKFGNKFRLNEHLRAKHGYEKYKCGECDFQTASSATLTNHTRRHRGEKPFVCELCGANFHASYLLAQHRQSHRTEKLYKCNLCPASFKVNNALHMHKLSCHSKSTFKCALCPRVYSCRHYAVKHLRALHRYSGPIGDLEQKTIC